MASSAEPPQELGTQPLLLHNWVCPYVHRVTLALAHKQARGRMAEVEVDLANKPAWLARFSPTGKVPAICYMEGGQQQTLFESLVLLQWVEDYFSKAGPALLPESAAARARARIMMTRFDSAFVPSFYAAIRCTDAAEFTGIVRTMRAELGWLSEQMDPTGPYMLGPEPSMVDAACAPWLLRNCVVQEMRNVDMLEGLPRINTWLDAYKARPDVQSTYRPPPGTSWEEGMVQVYQQYTKTGKVDMSAAAAAAKA